MIIDVFCVAVVNCGLDARSGANGGADPADDKG
jgi:hypothetical protein